jgi:uncharacterized membrane protein YdjX (TVP38/TMEM64 family)
MRMLHDLKKLAILVFAASVIILFFVFDLKKYMSLDALQATRETLERFYATHRFTTVAAFMALYILQSALALPGPLVMSIAAGAVFGVVMGTIYCLIAATVGASLAFLGSRYLFRDAVQKKFGVRLEKVNVELEKEGLRHLLFLRLVPLFPFTLINIAAGLSRMPLRTFLMGTAIGILPPSFVFCNAGASIVSIDTVREILSPRMLGSLVLLGFFALMPVIYGKLRKQNGK